MNQGTKITEMFAKFQLGKVKLGPSWANTEISLDTSDSDAAWELYVEMLTRCKHQVTGFGSDVSLHPYGVLARRRMRSFSLGLGLLFPGIRWP